MAVSGIDLGKYQLGWSTHRRYVFKPKKGLNEDIVREHLVAQVRARVDDDVPAERAETVRT